MTNATDPVIIALTGVTSLGGTLTAVPRNGIATFSNLTVQPCRRRIHTLGNQPRPRLRNQYQLHHQHPASGAARPPAKLAFLQQPSNALAGDAISPAVQVAVEDSGGKAVASGNYPVTLSLGTNPTNSSLTGQLSAISTMGVASFGDVNVNLPGTGYRLQASSPGLTPVVSNAFSVIPLSAGGVIGYWKHPGNAASPFNIPLSAAEKLSPVPPGFSSLQIDLSSWFSPASSPGVWQASATDPTVHVLFNLNSFANVASGTWKRQGNSPTVEAQILASSSTAYPVATSFGLYSKYYYMTTSISGTGWVPPMPPALNPQTATPATGLTVHSPADATPANDSDGYFAIFQPDGTVLECYSGIILSSGTIICGTENVTHSWSNLLGAEGGIMASTVPVYAGLVRQADIDSGIIAHALNICISPTQLTTSYTSPAISFDRTPRYSGTLPMGTRLAIPFALNLSSHQFHSTVGAMIARAAQNYGAFLLDRGGPNGFTIRAEKNMTDPAFTNAWDYNTQLDLDWILSQLQLVQ